MLRFTDNGVETGGMPNRTVALTFNGGPDPRWTPRLLDLLRRYDARGTFFLYGAEAARHPALVRRIRAEGHEIGSYGYTGGDLGSASPLRGRLELSLSRTALAGAAGVDPHLLRMPHTTTADTLCGGEWPAAEKAAKQGYLIVAADHRSRRPTQGVVRQYSQTDLGLHEARDVLRNPRIENYTTVTEGLGQSAENDSATRIERLRGVGLVWLQGIGNAFAHLMAWALGIAGTLGVLRLLLLALLARLHVRRIDRERKGAPRLREVVEPVSVVMPAYNEEAGIAATLRSLLASTHPNVQVIVVDDGSSDGTAEIAESIRDPRVTVIRQPNGGKAKALNTGLAYAQHEIVVMVDADTVFEPDALHRLIQPLAHAAVGAVSGNTKVGNRHGLLGRWQHLEYVHGFNLDRRMFEVLECMPTVPGAIGAFRREALLGIGGVSDDTLAEDTDLTMALWRAGWRVVYQETAIAWTEVPSTLRQLWQQRYRWCYGTLQSMWKHRHALIEVGPAGRFARRALSYLALFQILLPLFAPVVDVFALYGALFQDPTQALSVWLAFLFIQLCTAAYALRLDGERLRSLWSLPFQLFVYRQLLYLVVIQSVVTALLGTRLKWQQMRRTGTADQHLRGELPGNKRTLTGATGVAAHQAEGVVVSGAGGGAVSQASYVEGRVVSSAADPQGPWWRDDVGSQGQALYGGPYGDVPYGEAGFGNAAYGSGRELPDGGASGGHPVPQDVEALEARRAAPVRRRRTMKRRRPMRRLVTTLVVLALLAGTGTVAWANTSLDRSVDLNTFKAPRPTSAGTNYLVVGSDSRKGLSEADIKDLHTGVAGGRRADSMILLHKGVHGTTMVSLPRDSYVSFPPFTHPSTGKRTGPVKNKLNAAFAYGGAKLLARTIEYNTGLRIDRYAEVGFAGFVKVVDAVGGVRMCLKQAIKDEKSGADLPKGCQTLDGAQALAFVRQRHQESEGDIGRSRNQQKFLSALAHKAAERKTLTDPQKMLPAVQAGLNTLTVDDGTGLRDLAELLRAVQGMSGGKGQQINVPIGARGVATPHGSALLWDPDKSRRLFAQLRADQPVTEQGEK